MSLPTITIRGKKYPQPSLDRLKRKQVKKIKPVLTRVQNEDLDAIWDTVGLLISDLPSTVLDDLELGECKTIIEAAGIAKFSNDEEPASGADDDEITVGESSASTNS
ncbi:MAG: hypothetical protein ACTII7_07795 [Galactobacter sp.]